MLSAKILLIQHNEVLRQARSLVFGGAFFHALSLRESSQVRDYLARESVDVILADCRGADASGLDFVESLRKAQPRAKVILVADGLDLPTVVRGIRLGIKDVFQPPLDLEALMKRITDFAGTREGSGEALRNADWSSLE